MLRFMGILLVFILFACPIQGQEIVKPLKETKSKTNIILRGEKKDKNKKNKDKKIKENKTKDDDYSKLRKKLKNLEKEVKSLKKQQKPDKGEIPFRVYWKDKLRFKSHDKNFSMAVGGRSFVDFGFIDEDSEIENIDSSEDFAEFRSARMYLSGTIYKRFIFKVQAEFAGQARLKSGYIGVKHLPLKGVFKAGIIKEPFGLETYSSGSATTFMERSSVSSAFSPGTNLGFLYSGRAKNFTISMGLFREIIDSTLPEVDADSGSYAFTSRLTFTPYYAEKGKQLFHIGTGYSYRNPLGDFVRYRARPESHGASKKIVDTGTIFNIEDIHLANVEGAVVFGPFSLQAELMGAWNRSEGGFKPAVQEYWGYYVQGSFFLTGDNRNYNKKNGAFTVVRPIKNAFEDGGLGAVEIAIRYSKLNLNDDDTNGTDGRRMDNISVGLNWYLNPNMRIMMNYIHSRVAHVNFERPESNIFMTRFQVNF